MKKNHLSQLLQFTAFSHFRPPIAPQKNTTPPRNLMSNPQITSILHNKKLTAVVEFLMDFGKVAEEMN